MLYDRAKIHVEAGSGGDGAVSFRREAHVPKGGPDGGDAGRGAEVVLICDGSLRDLQRFRQRSSYKGGAGGRGGRGNRHGASASAVELRVPPGTTVEHLGRAARYELIVAGERVVIARGGAGGRGNAHFATATRQTPTFAERGLAGEQAWIELRLRLLADVGLVGLPNAGKSSLLARLTRAKPKVASYPFTTLEPVLGTLETADRQLVIADIPGLIEGASSGAGLGDDFLAHIERTRLVVHVLDLAPLDQSDPVENHATVQQELRSYGAGLDELPQLLCLSKADLVAPDRARAAAEQWRDRLAGQVRDVVVTSSATGEGLAALGATVAGHVPPPAPASAPVVESLADHRVYRPAAAEGFAVERAGNGRFRAGGPAVERLIARHDLGNQEALHYVADRLRAIGVMRALAGAGFVAGDELEIGDLVLELDPARPLRGA